MLEDIQVPVNKYRSLVEFIIYSNPCLKLQQMIPLVFLGGVGLGVGEIGILKSGSFNPSMVSLLQLPLATGSISLLDE